MANAAGIHALLITPDPWLVMNFTNISRELGIEAHASAKTSGVPEELDQAKYEAVLVDFDNLPEALPILTNLRHNPANRTALLFAVATGVDHRKQVPEEAVNFVLARPFDAKEIRRVLYAAYETMARERRRYFRCSAEMPALLAKVNGEPALKCTTINLSGSGLALNTPSPLNVAEPVQIVLFLQGQPAVRLDGTVVWDDKHGKTGFSFECRFEEDRRELDAWLDSHFRQLLTPLA